MPNKWNINFRKPTFEEFWEEFHVEQNASTAQAHMDAAKKVYETGIIRRIPKSQIELENEFPKLAWLNAYTVFEDPNFDYRYWPKHHIDLIPAMKHGRPVVMPCAFKNRRGLYNPVYGRHRMAYSAVAKGYCDCFIVDIGLWDDFIESEDKRINETFKVKVTSVTDNGYTVSKKLPKALYFGSPTEVTRLDVTKGKGIFGNGLYLTPDIKWAEFYAEGGRQGGGSYRIKTGTGFVYKVDIKPRSVLKILDSEKVCSALRDIPHIEEEVDEAYAMGGDCLSSRVTSFYPHLAREEGADVIWYAETGGVLTPIEQILVLDNSAIAGFKLVNKIGSKTSKAKGSVLDFPKTELCKEIWVKDPENHDLLPTLNPKLKDLILKTILKNLAKHGLKLVACHFYGGSASYQYTDTSDVDIDLFVDWDKAGKDKVNKALDIQDAFKQIEVMYGTHPVHFYLKTPCLMIFICFASQARSKFFNISSICLALALATAMKSLK